MPPLLRTAVRITLGVLAAAVLLVAFRETWDRTEGSVLPSWQSFVVSGVLVVAGLAFAAESWRCLFADAYPRARVSHGFFTSQLGKYLPGAIWQPMGLVALTGRAGVPLGRASAAFPVHALAQVAAGGTLAGALAVTPVPLPAGVRLGSLAGLLFPLILRRGWLLRAAGVVERVTRRGAGHLVPEQGAVIRAYVWSGATLIATGSGFAVLAAELDVPSTAAAPLAYAAAWTAGFLALPFPSGIGVREAVLVGIFSAAGVAPIIAASVAHRLVTIVAEALMIALSAIGLRRSASPPVQERTDED